MIFQVPTDIENFTLKTAYGRDAVSDQIERDIDQWCKVFYESGFRNHLGASEIGHKCNAFLWYKFRWMFKENFNGRMLRLFQRGHSEEPKLIAWLTNIGCKIESINPETGKQYRFTKFGGHFSGSCDGLIYLPERYGIKEKVLLELKTNKDYGRVDFDTLRGSGVKKYIPKHYRQMCTYGKKFGVHYALYVAINKNTDEIHPEIIELDWNEAEDDERKAEFIILSQTRPSRISENPSYYECKFCPALSICHLKAPILKNCRSCQYAKPIEDGWHCDYWNRPIPKDFIEKGCDSWTPLFRLA